MDTIVLFLGRLREADCITDPKDQNANVFVFLIPGIREFLVIYREKLYEMIEILLDLRFFGRAFGDILFDLLCYTTIESELSEKVVQWYKPGANLAPNENDVITLVEWVKREFDIVWDS